MSEVSLALKMCSSLLTVYIFLQSLASYLDLAVSGDPKCQFLFLNAHLNKVFKTIGYIKLHTGI